jgi:hypothetical protein
LFAPRKETLRQVSLPLGAPFWDKFMWFFATLLEALKGFLKATSSTILYLGVAMRKTLVLFIIFFFVYSSPIFPQTPIIKIYGVQLLSTLDDIKRSFSSLQLEVDNSLTPVFIGQRTPSSALLNLEFMDIEMGKSTTKSYKLTAISRVEYERNLDVWEIIASLYANEIGGQPNVIENYPLKMAVWAFPKTNTILTVSYNYEDQRVVERLYWDLSSISN